MGHLLIKAIISSGHGNTDEAINSKLYLVSQLPAEVQYLSRTYLMFVSQNKLNVYNTSSLYNLWESFPSLNILVFSFIILLSLMFLTQVNFHVQGFLLCFDYFHMYQKRLKLLSSSSLSLSSTLRSQVALIFNWNSCKLISDSFCRFCLLYAHLKIKSSIY